MNDNPTKLPAQYENAVFDKLIKIKPDLEALLAIGLEFVGDGAELNFETGNCKFTLKKR